jgi:anti-sigma B factor antagonist
MTLQITHRVMRAIDVLQLKGPLTFGEPDLLLQSEIEELIAGGKTRLVLDLGEVSEIDSTGCLTLLCTEERVRRLGGGLALVHMGAPRRNPLEVGKLERVFHPFELDQEAVNSFFSDLRVNHIDLLELIKSYRKEAHPRSSVESGRIGTSGL